MLPGKQYTPEVILGILRKRAWFLLVPLAVAAAATALWSRTLPDLYRSQTIVQVVPQRISPTLVRSTIETRIEDRLPAIREAILSRTRLESMILEFDLYPEERKYMVMEDVVGMMYDHIDTWIIRQDAFGVAFTGTDPVKVMRVTERLGNLFIEQSLSYRHNLTEVTDEFLESQLDETRRELEAQERRLEAYRRTYAGELPTQVEANLQQLNTANTQIQQLANNINQALARRLVLEQELNDLRQRSLDALPTSSGALADAGEGRELLAAQAAVDELRARGLRPGHPDLDAALRNLREAEARYAGRSSDSSTVRSPGEVARQARIDSLAEQIAEIDRQVADARVAQQRFQAMADAAQARIDAAPTRETEMIALMRDYDIIADKYRGLLQKREEARISANLERRQVGEQFSIIDPARVPERPYSPDRRRINAAGAFVGLVLGMVLVAVLEYRDRGFRNDEEVEAVMGLPVLAVIPIMRSEAEQRRRLWRRVAVNAGLSVVVAGCALVCAYLYLST